MRMWIMRIGVLAIGALVVIGLVAARGGFDLEDGGVIVAPHREVLSPSYMRIVALVMVGPGAVGEEAGDDIITILMRDQSAKVRVGFGIRASVGGIAYGRLYKSTPGVGTIQAVGKERSVRSTEYTVFFDELSLTDGDTLGVYLKSSGAPHAVYIDTIYVDKVRGH